MVTIIIRYINYNFANRKIEITVNRFCCKDRVDCSTLFML